MFMAECVQTGSKVLVAQLSYQLWKSGSPTTRLPLNFENQCIITFENTFEGFSVSSIGCVQVQTT